MTQTGVNAVQHVDNACLDFGLKFFVSVCATFVSSVNDVQHGIYKIFDTKRANFRENFYICFFSIQLFKKMEFCVKKPGYDVYDDVSV